MGAWGVGIFDDDVACDARNALYDLFRDGQSVSEATDAVIQDLSDMMEDEEDGPVIILALAAAQWEAGRLDERIKKQALNIIEQGVDLRWQDSEQSEKRREVLGELAAKLNRRPPKAKPVAELED
jgi:benzoyl-CoA reductase/2-hydroxyglutaryl-CoA dehydratase subunit BcrC/BadD/HgdB